MMLDDATWQGLNAAHLATTLFMTGLIWFVQIVHYPLFAQVGSEGFALYEATHASRITWIVAPVMAIELGTAAIIAIAPAPFAPASLAWLGFGAVLIIWASTAFIQVPCHARLSRGFDTATHRRLVNSNWIRTVAWTGRAALALSLALGATP